MLNVCFINGSPKANKTSNSDFFIHQLSLYFDENINTTEYYARNVITNPELFEKIIKNDKLILISPLYADTVPSVMLRFLEMFEEYLKNKNYNKVEVYGMINCGFFEGIQNRYALDVFKYFCQRSGLKWRFGIGIGGGEFLANSSKTPQKMPTHKSLFRALSILGKDITHTDYNIKDNLFISPDKMSAWLYRFNGNLGWYYQAFFKCRNRFPRLFKKIY